MAPRPPAVPAGATGAAVLLIEVNPGGAQAYIDDEPVGTTSSEGRLKLTKLAPGSHRVRISLRGYRDYEQNVELVTGQTIMVTASLESSATASSGANPLAGPAGPASEPPPDTASLGAALAMTHPSGVRGVYVQQVLAGLRAGNAILSVGGRSVTTPDQLQEILAGLHPGDTVDITYADGQTVRSTQAQLVSRSSLSFPPALGVPGSGANPLAAAQPTAAAVVRFSVAHDHGSGGTDYCVGELLVGNARIAFQGATSNHSFNPPISELKEAKKNAVYLALLGGFHIRFKKKGNYNFVSLNAAGQPQPPDELIMSVARAMGQE